MKKKILLISAILITGTLTTVGAYAQQDETQKTKEQDSLKVTGKFTVRSFYDFKYYEAKEDFIPSAIPLKKDEAKRKLLDFDVPGAKIIIEKKLPFAGDVIEFSIGSNLAPKKVELDHAYANYKNFKIGLAISNFCNPDAMPNILDGVHCSAVFANVAQVSWKHQVGKDYSYVVAIEKALQPDLYPKIAKEEEKNEKDLIPQKALPALAANIKFEKEFGHVQLSGLLRVFDYYDKKQKQDKYLPTWGINLSTVLNIIPEKTILKLYGLYGMGIGSYICDFAGVPKTENKDFFFAKGSELATIDAWGGYIGIEHHWIPKLLRSTVAYGILDSTAHKRRGDDAYKQGHYASGNLTFHPTDYFTIGAEYLYGARFSVKENDKGEDAHRVQALVSFSF